MEPFKIFVSHRHEDAAIAVQLADRLRMYGEGNLELFLSENVVPGDVWRKWITETIGRAELLLFLLTAPSDLSSGWEWSLYEVGLFSGSTDTNKRIVALSPPNLEVPSLLADIQNVKAVRDPVASFLNELFGGTALTGREEPINRYFAEDHDRVLELAGEICAMLAPLPAGARMHTNSLILKFEESLHEPVIPEDVEIEVDAMSLKMFGLLGRDQFTWGDIHRSLHGERTWVSELSEAIYAISNGRYAKPIMSTFPSAEGQSFIPVVYRDETRFSGSRLFHVLFVPTDIVPVDPELVFVITAFSNDMEPIYEAIKAAVSKYSLSAKRVKDIVGDYRITDKILNMISQATNTSWLILHMSGLMSISSLVMPEVLARQ